jgi:predicted nucleic acid-binding protein
MRIVLDTNIFFATIIKDSTTRKIILYYDGSFLFPSFIFDEMKFHFDELIKKSGLSKSEFIAVVSSLLRKMSIIDTKSLIKHREKAMRIVENIDTNDVIFFACALAHPESIIWSDDKKLKNQKQIKVLNTKEIIGQLRII